MTRGLAQAYVTGGALLVGTLLITALGHPVGAQTGPARLEEHEGFEDLGDLGEMPAAECGRCHEADLAEHLASAHARAFDDPLFQREWRQNPEPYCIPCHSPRTASPLAHPVLASAGVDCVTCHVRDGAVLAATVSGEAPHPSRVDPTLAGVEACARCHQVDVRHRPGTPLQNTVAEWEAAGEPGTCQSCHMPSRAGRHRHDTPGGYSRELLSRALTVRARAVHDGWDTRVDLELEADDVGHAVPTGDVFRRLVIHAWDASRPGEGRTVELGRAVGRVDGRGAYDDRVPPPGGGPRHVTIRLPGRVTEVGWSIELWSLPRDQATRAGLATAPLRRVMDEG
ncbi:MAG: hypothetical protein DRJ42_26560, partial [Deltaproteobacteria bacterium]